jgi:HAE1 family hydrophobic/amphiphilic exporter-1
MKLSHFFIDRPIFAAVISIFITLIGGFAYFTLPVSQYPDVATPTVVVKTSYPGASAQVVSDSVATPLEQQINGVENMLYMVSQATGDGNLNLTITFKLGTDLDIAQVLVQNRVSIALSQLPEEVVREGVTVKKNSPDLLMVVHLSSPDGSRDQLYISNYATLQIKDVLARLEGVGDVVIFGARDYAMRVWVNPNRLAAHNLTAGDVVSAIRAQNVQVSAGVLDQPPIPRQGDFQLNVETLGRLVDPRQFANIVINTDSQGRVTRLSDIGRVELAAQDYSVNGYLDHHTAVPMGIFQQPGTNALDTAHRVEATMAELSKYFPQGMRYDIVYNPTQFISESVNEVIKTIYEAASLVVIVMILFLQTWRASIIPIIAIPVSLIGTLPSWRRWDSPSTTCRCSAWFWPSASWSTTPSSWSRTSSATCAKAWRRARPPTRPWTRSAARWWRSPSCSRRSSSPRPSSPASPASSSASSPSPSPRRPASPSSSR